MTKVIDEGRSHTIHSIKGILGKPSIGSLPCAYFSETAPHPVNDVARTGLFYRHHHSSFDIEKPIMNFNYHRACKWHSCMVNLKDGPVVSGNQAMFPLTSIEWLAPLKGV